MATLEERLFGPRLRAFLRDNSDANADMELVVSLTKSPVNLLKQNFTNWKTRDEKVRNVRNRILAFQKPVLQAFANSPGFVVKFSLWINNKIILKGTRGAFDVLRTSPFDAGVINRISRIDLVHTIKYPVTEPRHDHRLKKIGDGGGTPRRLPSANLVKIGAPQVWETGVQGEKVTIALVDCGVHYEHPDLVGQMWDASSAIFNGASLASIHGYDCGEMASDPKDLGFHGTFSAGILVGNGTKSTVTGVAPKAKLMALKVTKKKKIDDTKHEIVITDAACWMAGQYAVENDAHLICSTISFPYTAPVEDMPDVESWRQKCDLLALLSIVLVNSAGNGTYPAGRLPPPYNVDIPASCPPPVLSTDQKMLKIGGTSSVLAVGAAMKDDSIDTQSSSGPCEWNLSVFNDYPSSSLFKPDLCAPSEEIVSCTAPLLVSPDTVENVPYATGATAHTSASAPHVAGALALIMSSVGPAAWNQAQMKKAVGLVISYCDPMLGQSILGNAPVPDNKHGAGQLNIFKAGQGTFW